STPVSEGGYGRQQFDLEKRYEVTLCGDGRHPVASGGLQDPKSVPLPVLNDSTAANTSVQTEVEMINNRPTEDPVDFST
ncbi:hypothetical protein J0689_27870, partial [Vibrio parahaemolyticus]|uniref:hypothetical protein n=1 Tax=Vibrio parahaemolyticus TaxID=670 RepID=UPI001A8CEE4B